MKASKGFSLLEMLVAFTLLAITLPVLLKIFSSGVNTAFIAEEYTAAVQIATSRMAVSGVEEAWLVGESTGIENEKYHWRTTIRLINHPIHTADDTRLEFLQVDVTVSWDDATKQARSFELNTLVAKHKE